MLSHVPAFLGWLAEEHSATTVANYRCRLQQFARWCVAGDHPFSRRSVAHWLGELQERGKRPKTVRGHHAALMCFARYLTSQELEAPNLGAMKLPRLDQPQAVCPTDSEVQALFEGVERMPAHTPVLRYRKTVTRCMLSIYAYTGLRAMEQVRLNLADYRDDASGNPCLYVRKGKGQVPRWVPVNAVLAGHLAEWLRVRALWLRECDPEQEALLLNDKRRRLGYGGVRGLWEALLEFAGLRGSGIKRHSLRHWFISEVAASEGVKVAQDLAGHADPGTTSKYMHAQPQKMRRGVEGLVGLTRREGRSPVKGQRVRVAR